VITYVFLVHGTFANDATWVNADSAISKKLKLEFPHWQILDHPFRWSGDNSFKARKEAATDLVGRLNQIQAPEEVIFVAHSHGGSLVHYAFNHSPAAFRRVSAIACLSTPFFGFSPRQGYEALLNGTIVSTVFLLFQLSMLGLVFLGKAWFKGMGDEAYPILGFGMGLIVAAITTITIISRNRNKIYSWFNKGIDDVMPFDSTSIRLKCKVAYFRAMGDEIALALSVGQALATVTSLALSLIAHSIDQIVSRIRSLWRTTLGKISLIGFAAVSIFMSALPAYFFVEFGEWFGSMWIFSPGIQIDGVESRWLEFLIKAAMQVTTFFLVASVLTSAILLLVLTFGWFLSWLLLGSFGTWNASAALAMEFAVEPTPEGPCTFINNGWNRNIEVLRNARSILQHSEPYSSESAQKALCIWLKAVVVARKDES
jgi:pimeloyl-ACP methyl ester carboxylesterase